MIRTCQKCGATYSYQMDLVGDCESTSEKNKKIFAVVPKRGAKAA